MCGSSLIRISSYALFVSRLLTPICLSQCLTSNGMSVLHAIALHRFNGFMSVTPVRWLVLVYSDEAFDYHMLYPIAQLLLNSTLLSLLTYTRQPSNFFSVNFSNLYSNWYVPPIHKHPLLYLLQTHHPSSRLYVLLAS